MRRLLLTAVLLLTAIGMMYSAYLSFEPIAVTQPDGTKLDLFATGDEFYNWLHDKNGYTIKQNDKGWFVYMEKNAEDELEFTDLIAGRDEPEASNLSPWTNISPQKMGEIRNNALQQLRDISSGRTPTTGTINNIVIFIRFSDQTEFGEIITNYSSKFNGTTGNTMQSYFWEASYNTLDISTTFYPTPTAFVVSWQDTAHPRAYYSPYNATTNPIGYSGDTERTNREHTLLVNAVNGVSSTIPSELIVDADGDGRVDNVCFIIKGATDAWASLLWPHRWSLYSQYAYINGKRVYDYNFQISNHLATSGNGVLCHEMFHSLGAPDLYHYTSDGISPTGSWDVMCSNTNPPQHMGAFMKWKYGDWIPSIPAISTDATYILNPLSSPTNNCFRINSPNSTTEYFVVEYRQKTGTFENSLPGTGLLVYRINTTAGDGNADGPPDEVYIYRPNGTTTVNGTLSSAHFSLETGRTAISSTTNPTPFLTNGSAGGLVLSGIGSAGSTISFILGNPIPGAPVCTITAPINGTVYNLNSTISVNVTATDSDGTVSNVAFYIDDATTPSYTDYSAPYTWNWNTTGVSGGQHTIKAIATDNSSNTTPNEVTITLLAPANEGFETGNFIAYPWVQSGNLPWAVQTADKYSGIYAAKSGAISDSQSSSMAVTIDVTTSGIISFMQKVSSESGWDFLTFYIDDIEQGSWSGAGSWTYQSYAVTTGSHEFMWTYSKDTNTASGSDCAWVDHIILPPHTLPVEFYPPQNLAAAVGDGFVNLTWQTPAFGTPTGYRIYKNSSLLTTVTDLSYTDNAVVNGTTYSYYLVATYTGGDSDPTATVNATPNLTTSVILGSGTSSNSLTTASPINVYYESLHGQAVYTASELNAAGIFGPIDILELGFNITGLPTLAMPNFVVRMKHTAATDVASWITAEDMITVWTSTSYLPTSTGWNMLPLSIPFTWNGTDNIVIDTAFGVIGEWTESGTTQYTEVTNGYRYVRYDYEDQTNVFTGGSTSIYRPNLKLTLLLDPLVTPMNITIVNAETPGSAIISWSASSGNHDGYYVYIASLPDFSDATLLATLPSTQTSYTDELAYTRERAFYRVTAYRD